MQIWYIVSEDHIDTYKAGMRAKYPEHCLVSKTLYPENPSHDELTTGKISRIVQRPGDLVITQPVSTKTAVLILLFLHITC